MQPPPQVRRVALGAHYYFVRDHSPTPCGLARLLVQIKPPILYFVPFYALFLGFVLSPAGPTKTRKPPVHHQQGQFRGSTLRLALLRRLLEPLLGLGLGLCARSLHQRMDHRVVNLTTPFARYPGRTLIRTRQRPRASQFPLQYRTHLLMGPQTPPLSNGTGPMLILRVLPVPHL